MYQLANNVLGQLKYAIAGADVSLVFAPLAGVPPFNVPPAPTDQVATFGAPFGIVTLMDRLDPSAAKIEHIRYSARAPELAGAYTLTTSAALRGQEGTVAQAWAAGAYVVQIATADVLAMNTARAVQRSASLLTHKLTGLLAWDGGNFTFDTFVVHGAGRGNHWGSDGYFTIGIPANGTTVHGHGGAVDVLVAGAAINIAARTSLYFEPKISGANATVPGNFHLVGETADFVVPAHWILLAVHSEVLAGEKVLRVANGQTLTVGGGLTPASGHNFLINGSFDFARYAASYVATLAVAYGCVDRWYMGQSTLAQTTFSQAAPAPALPGYSKCLKVLLTGPSVGVVRWGQVMESVDVSALQGQTVVISFSALKGSTWNPANLRLRIFTGTGTDQGSVSVDAGTWTAQATTLDTNLAPTAAWVTYSATVAIPAGATELAVHFSATPTGAAVDANSYLMMTGADFRVGTVAPASRDSRPLQAELALCERFLPGFSGINAFATGHAFTTTDVLCDFHYTVTPRVAPTGLSAGAAAGDFQVWDGAGNVVACTVLPTLNRASVRAATIRGTVGAGLTVGRGTSLMGATANAKILLTGCEL